MAITTISNWGARKFFAEVPEEKVFRCVCGRTQVDIKSSGG
jgi:hypothetical protein